MKEGLNFIQISPKGEVSKYSIAVWNNDYNNSYCILMNYISLAGMAVDVIWLCEFFLSVCKLLPSITNAVAYASVYLW